MALIILPNPFIFWIFIDQARNQLKIQKIKMDFHENSYRIRLVSDPMTIMTECNDKKYEFSWKFI